MDTRRMLLQQNIGAPVHFSLSSDLKIIIKKNNNFTFFIFK